MFELVLQVIAYTGVGIAVLAAGFLVTDALTPGKLGALVMDRNPNAAVLAAANLLALGLILYFAIYFTGEDWEGLWDALVFGLVGVALQAAGFLALDLLTPGKLGDVVREPGLHPAAWVIAGIQLAVALVICASLT